MDPDRPRRRRAWRTGALAGAVLAGAALLSGCGGSTLRAAGGIRVVAGEDAWGNIAAQIGGPRVVVTSLISATNTDPHLFESDARDAAAVALAQVVIVNGAGYDDFLTKLLAAAGHHPDVVEIASVLHASSSANPHFWYGVERVPVVAAAITTALVRADPPGAAGFKRRLATFDASLGPIDAQLRAISARDPGARVAYTERLPGYLLGEAGLAVATPVGFAAAIESGAQPSAADAAAMDALITHHRVRALLYNLQTTAPATAHLRVLAQRAHVPVLGLYETLPPGAPTYQSWMLGVTRALARALGR